MLVVGIFLLLPGTAGTKVNVKLPLPQTITDLSSFDSGSEWLHARVFLTSEKVPNCEWAYSLSRSKTGTGS